MSLKVYLSQAAQQTAYAAGLPASATLEFPVPAELVDRFFALGGAINAQGQPELDARAFYVDKYANGGSDYVYLPEPCSTVEEALAQLERLLVEHKAAEAEKVAEKKAWRNAQLDEARQWLQEWPVERLAERWASMNTLQGVQVPDTYRLPEELGTQIKQRQRDAIDHAYRALDVPLSALVEARDIGDLDGYDIYRVARGTVRFADHNLDTDILHRLGDTKQQVKALVDQANSEHRAALRQWIVKHFAEDPTAAARFDEEVLPLKEIAERLRDEMFAPLDGFGRYKRLTNKHVDHTEECYHGDLSYESEDGVESCSAAEWAQYQQIKAAAPKDADVQLREHKAECRGCEATAIRNSCMVTLRQFGFRLSREYGLEG